MSLQACLFLLPPPESTCTPPQSNSTYRTKDRGTHRRTLQCREIFIIRIHYFSSEACLQIGMISLTQHCTRTDTSPWRICTPSVTLYCRWPYCSPSLSSITHLRAFPGGPTSPMPTLYSDTPRLCTLIDGSHTIPAIGCARMRHTLNSQNSCT